MHYKINQYLEENPLDKDYEELVIKCDSEEQYNSILDALFKAGDGKFKVFGVIPRRKLNEAKCPLSSTCDSF